MMRNTFDAILLEALFRARVAPYSGAENNTLARRHFIRDLRAIVAEGR